MVSGAGGVPSKVTEVTETSGFYRHPTFLPDGRRFLYDGGAGREAGIYLASLDQKADSKSRRRILSDISNAQYLSPSDGSLHGYVLFVREGTLMAQPVDPKDMRSAGDVFPVIEQVSSLFGTVANLYSISGNGIIVHLSGSADLRQYAIFDRRGKQIAAIGTPLRTPGRVALSPDNRRTISERFRAGRKIDLWISDLDRGTESRFTFDDSTNSVPVWSPDGSYVAFASNRGGAIGSLYRKPANQAGEDELLLRSEFLKFPTDWSHDGRFIIFRQASRNSNIDLFALPVSGDRKPIPLLTSGSNEIEGTVSPDGRWLAYASDASGSYEVYVQPFAPGSSRHSGGQWQISVGGGRDPHWRGDGREMFYIAPDRKMMAMAVNTKGGDFVRRAPQPLFEVRLPLDEAAAGGTTISRYAVSADGQRFLMSAEPEASYELQTLHVTVNWLAGVKME